jgi:hypothetical protein
MVAFSPESPLCFCARPTALGSNQRSLSLTLQTFRFRYGFDAVIWRYPVPGRRVPPTRVSLLASPVSFSNPHAQAQTSTARAPHPEVHMEYIAEDPIRAWHYQVRAFFLPSPGA